MTISRYDLERALQLRDTVDEINTFVHGLATWGGSCYITVGSYKVTVGGERFSKVLQLLYEEREVLLTELGELGVDMKDSQAPEGIAEVYAKTVADAKIAFEELGIREHGRIRAQTEGERGYVLTTHEQPI